MGGEAVFEVVVAPREDAFMWAAILTNVFDRLVGTEGAGDRKGVVVVTFADTFGTREVEEYRPLEGVVAFAR